jgi:hypothetical protein
MWSVCDLDCEILKNYVVTHYVTEPKIKPAAGTSLTDFVAQTVAQVFDTLSFAPYSLVFQQ